ncbi:MAG: GNAT family N-acetyltransferase [Nakamurella sp.]
MIDQTDGATSSAPADNGSALTVRALGPDDLPDILALDSSAFGQDPPPGFLEELIVPWLELDRFVGTRDPAVDNELVAQGCIFSKAMTFPGNRVHPVAGVSWVGVRAGWRRRGLLRGLMKEQLHGLHDTGGEPVAILTASEAALYGRFGYGQAIKRNALSLVHGAAFRPGVAIEPVREIRADTAPAIIKPLYARVSAGRPGHLARRDELWTMRFANHEFLRDGTSKRKWAIHPDGFVSYRIKLDWNDRGPNGTLILDEICAGTPVAFASLWRFLLDLELCREITYRSGWIDDPVQDLLLDPRTLASKPHDHVWLRIVDLDRTVDLRSYSASARVVVELRDDFCPWNAGVWLFELGPDGGRVSRSTDEPQVQLDTTDLAACFVGGTPLGRLVAGGRVNGETSALLQLGAALATPVAPWCPEGF